MRKNLTIFFMTLFFMIGVSCTSDDTGDVGKDGCVEDGDCSYPMVCDKETNECVPPGSGDTGDSSDSGNTGDSSNTGNTGNTGNNGESEDVIDPDASCDPGEVGTCSYTGPSETKNVGVCKPGQAICQPDETWGPCEGEVLPSAELCDSGRDENCDGIVDNCDAEENPVGFEEIICDESLPSDSNDPRDFARAMELCVDANPGDDFGLLEAHFLMPDETCCPQEASYAILSSLGAITPRRGKSMVALSSGVADSPFPSSSTNHKDMGTSSNPPTDWYAANGNAFPSSPACGDSGTSGGLANDPVMLKLKIKAPPKAKAFEFNIFFLSVEFPQWVCSEYNDFFVALLDSSHTSDDPDMQNPVDKNLARDKHDNQVGVNLAKSGLFSVCDNENYPSCESTAELAGSGLESHGGTGWLVTRGNVAPGEDITIRLAIWDSGDHAWDSIVLIDNFRWLGEESNPGTER